MFCHQSGLEKKALAHGYRTIYCSTNNDTAKTRELLTLLPERHMDGYILVASKGVEADTGALVRGGKWLALFDRLLPGVLANAVVVHGAAGTHEAAQYLLG